MDAEGNRGVSTPVASFNWLWPTVTTTQLEDLNPAPEVYDPRFSWNPVPGAARYEVEINSSSTSRPARRSAAAGRAIATSLSPTTVLKDNVYYWRVRALDPRRQRRRLELRHARSRRPSTRSRRRARSPGRASRTSACATTSTDPGTRRRSPAPTATRHAGAGRALGSACRARRATRCEIADWYRHDACLWATATVPEEDLGARVDAARRRTAATRSSGRARSPGRARRDHARRRTASASARAADRAAGQPGGLGRLHVPAERQHRLDRRRSARPSPGRLPEPGRARPRPPCASGYPCVGDYLAPLIGSTTDAHAALHLEAALRREQLLRRRRQGRELQQRDRRGVHADPGLRAAQLAQADDLHRRDDHVLLGDPAGDADRRQ